MEVEITRLKRRNAWHKFDGPTLRNGERREVVNGVELATCELEHRETPDAAPSTSPAHMPGLGMAASSSPCNHPVARAAQLASAAPAESTAGTSCFLPEARSGTESMPKKAGNDDTSDECCEVPPISVSRPMKGARKSGGRKIEKSKFLGANPCCDQRSCGSTVKREEELNVLVAKEPTGAICTVAEDEWVEIEVAIDSGATETVMVEETLSGIVDIIEGPALRRGVAYEVANGVEIPNLGERRFLRFTEEGGQRHHSTGLCSQQNAYECKQSGCSM